MGEKLRYAAKTDVGMRRAHNEDAYGILEGEGLLLVADGMGGHAAGEVASGIGISEVAEFFHQARAPRTEGWPYPRRPELTGLQNRLVCSFKVANRRIFDTANKEGGRRGMGTTLVAIALEEDQICIAHVGDSRVYRVKDGKITRLTKDHSLFEQWKEANPDMTEEEERSFPHKNVITRALGLNEDVEVEVQQQPLAPGDYYLLCSDGLSGHIRDDELRDIVTMSHGNLVGAVDKLVERANEEGGNDNITVVLVHYA